MSKMKYDNVRQWRPTKPPEYSTEFGKWLVINMLERGMSMRELARVTGVSRSVVGGHVHGDCTPSLSAMYQYIKLFGGNFVKLYEMLSLPASQ